MSSVTFSTALGGDGSTVTDDNDATTGLGNGGHRTRFVPALGQVVAVATNVINNANTAAYHAAAALVSQTAAATSASSAAASAAASGARWNFDSSTTMADPGTGEIRFNNATFSSVTQVAVSASSADSGNPDISDFILTWDDSTSTSKGTLSIRELGAPDSIVVFRVSGAITDNATWLLIPVTYVTNSGTITSGNQLVAQFSASGDAGDVSTTGAVASGNIVVFDDATGNAIRDGGSPNTVVLNVLGITSAVATTIPRVNAAGNGFDYVTPTALLVELGAISTAQLGVASGVATLNASAHLFSAQIPLKTINSTDIYGTGNIVVSSPVTDFAAFFNFQRDNTNFFTSANTARRMSYGSTYESIVSVQYDNNNSRWIYGSSNVNSDGQAYVRVSGGAQNLGQTGGSTIAADISLTQMDGTRTLVYYTGGNPSVFVYTNSGSSQSVGTEVTTTNTHNQIGSALVTTDTVLSVYLQDTTTSYARVFTTSGATVTANTQYATSFGNTVATNTAYKVVALSATKAVAFWSDATNIKAGVVNISGTTLTFGAATVIDTITGNTSIIALTLDSDNACVIYTKSARPHAVVITISGDTITPSTPLDSLLYGKSIGLESSSVSGGEALLSGQTIYAGFPVSDAAIIWQIAWDGSVTLTNGAITPVGVVSSNSSNARFVVSGTKMYCSMPGISSSDWVFKEVV